jgi:hypothetical protein
MTTENSVPNRQPAPWNRGRLIGNNSCVPSTLKAWIDHILRIHLTLQPTPEGKIGLRHDRPIGLSSPLNKPVDLS